MKQHLRNFYIEWRNDWLTVENFAAAHGLEIEHAMALIDMGRIYHDKHADFLIEIDNITNEFLGAQQ